jgi:hypothetical protein
MIFKIDLPELSSESQSETRTPKHLLFGSNQGPLFWCGLRIPPQSLTTARLILEGFCSNLQYMYMYRIRADARRSSSRFRQSDSVYTAAGDLGLHHGLDSLLALACDANGELIERGHHGVMATVQTCQRRAAPEVQILQIDASFNSIDVWNAQQKSVIIMG